MGKNPKGENLNLKDMSGLIFGRLTVLSRNGSDTAGARWDCKCICGVLINTRGSSLRGGITVSCGCYNRERITTHSKTRSGAYKSWRSAKSRCYYEGDIKYAKYGGSGIEMYTPWRDSFEEFYNYMGDRPEGMTLDRKDNSKGYFPDNCRWANTSQQASNRDYVQRGSSKYICVSRSTSGRWTASVKIPYGKLIHIGNFDTEDEAAIAYNKKVVELGLEDLRKLNVVEGGGSYDNRAS